MKIKVLLVLVLAGLSSAFATPAQIVIIRHAEKPADGNEVSSEGCERAFSLTAFFERNSTINAFGKPVAIYAMAPSHADGTLRPIETIAPTAQAMGLQENATYEKREGATFASAVLSNPDYDGKTVLVAWEHTAIPGLASDLGLPDDQIPQPWPDDVFDQVWVISYSGSGSVTSEPISTGEGHHHHHHDILAMKKSSADVQVSLQIIPEFVLPTDNPQGGGNWQNGPQQPTNSSPVVSSTIQSECINNNSLNAVARSVTVPASILTAFPLSGL